MQKNLSVNQISQHVNLVQQIPGFPYYLSKDDAKKLVEIGGLSAWMIEIDNYEVGAEIPQGHPLAMINDNRWNAGQRLTSRDYGTTICCYSCYSSFASAVDLIPEDAKFLLHMVEMDHPDDWNSATLRIYVTLDQLGSLSPDELKTLMDHQG